MFQLKNTSYLEYEKYLLFKFLPIQNSTVLENNAKEVLLSWPASISPSVSPTHFSACELGFAKNPQRAFRKSEPSVVSRVKSNKNLKCTTRSHYRIDEYMSLLQDSATYSTVKTHPMIDFLNVIYSKKISKISFVGDSITAQLGTFLGCDLLRTNDVEILHDYHLLTAGPKHLNSRDNHPIRKILFQYNRHKTELTALAMNTSLMCLYSSRWHNPACKQLKSRKETIFRYVYDILISTITNSTVQSPHAVVFNWGLHIQQYSKEWFVSSLVRAVIQFAQSSKGNYYVFFRETSAQHNAGSISGNYVDGKELHELYASGKIGNDKSEPCCNTFSGEDPGNLLSNSSLKQVFNYANKYLIQQFEAVDTKFRKYLPIIPFFNFSSTLHAFHVEELKHGKTIGLDCTHFIYAPLLFDGLWNEMTKALNQSIIVGAS